MNTIIIKEGEKVKCICGYERLEDDETEDENEVGDEPFVTINGNFTIHNYFDMIVDVQLKACPKCMIVQLVK